MLDDESRSWCELLDLNADATALTACDRFEKLAPFLVPDLSGLPFYAMPTSELPPEFTAASRHCGGWYSDWIYWQVQPHLQEDRARAGGRRPRCARRGANPDLGNGRS